MAREKVSIFIISAIPAIIISLSLFLSSFAPLAHAGVTTTGNVNPANPLQWHGLAYVGQTADGSVTINGGSVVNGSININIGQTSGVTGIVNVDGTGSKFTGGINVGYSGNGTLNITSGGIVDSSNATTYFGYNSGSTGLVNVDGAGSKLVTGSNYSFYIGYYGNGTLNITNSGAVSARVSTIGEQSGSTGVATVDGIGSTWTTSSGLFIGSSGNGILNITGGGVVNSGNDTTIGEIKGSTSTVNVDGASWIWTINSTYGFNVGLGGNGTLNITGGGAVVSNAAAVLGYSAGSIGTVEVDGANSTWTSSGIVVGYHGSGMLNITNGGAVNSIGTMEVGAAGLINFGDVGGTLTTGGLHVSPSQLTGSGTIYTRGLVSDVNLVFDSPASLSQTLTLNSQPGQNISVCIDVTNGGELSAGYLGSGSLTIKNGINIAYTYGYIGYGSASTGVVNVDGIGSKLTNSGDHLSIGYGGSGTLNITGGGAVTLNQAYIGDQSGSTGAVNVDGTGSTWTSSGFVYVGSSGRGTLNITGGGAVTSGNASIGYSSGSTGMVTVDGAESIWTNNGWLYVGNSGKATLSITNGGDFVSNSAVIGLNSGASGVVSIDGAGSVLNISGTLNVGSSGSGTLNITNSGAVVAGTTYIRPAGLIDFGDAGGTLTTGSLYTPLSLLKGSGTICTGSFMSDVNLVFDSPASLSQTLNLNSFPGQNISVCLDVTSGGGLCAGYFGSGSLEILHGVTVTSSSGYIGYNSGSTGTARVDGAGSKWINGNLTVGSSGAGTLNITNGGAVSATNVFIGSNSSGTGTLNITNGGAISASNVSIGSNKGSTGIITVDGVASTMFSGGIYVGNSGTGTLNITNGGAVSASNVFIGSNKGSIGIITVDGVASTMFSGSIYVGNSGNGTLNIQNGGAVTAGYASVSSAGMLAIDAGFGSSFVVNSGPGTFFNSGTVRLLAGAIAAAGAYSPISAGKWYSSGIYQPVGGKWNPTTHVFTVTAAQSAAVGEQVQIDLATTQRILVTDPSTGRAVGASFLGAVSSTPLSVLVSSVGGDAMLALETAAGAGESVLVGWTFSAPGYAEGTPTYLSFNVGPGLSAADLTVWHYDGSSWTKYAGDLSYDGTFANFTVTGFSGYAITEAPEPASLALLASSGLALLRRRRLAR